MNTMESNQIEVSDTSDAAECFTVDLIPAAELVDGAEIDLAGELVLAAELSDEETEIALDAIAISPEGLALNAESWRLRDEIASAIAPKLAAIRHARQQLFRGLDERTLPRIIRIQSA
jgi:hypothetical protein